MKPLLHITFQMDYYDDVWSKGGSCDRLKEKPGQLHATSSHTATKLGQRVHCFFSQGSIGLD